MKHSDKFYLVNINDADFSEGDTIKFEMPPMCSGDYEATVFKDEKGLFIARDKNWFEGCRDYAIIKKQPAPTPEAMLEEVGKLNPKALIVSGITERDQKGLNACIVDIDRTDNVLVYDYEKLIDYWMKGGMSNEDAAEWYSYNVSRIFERREHGDKNAPKIKNYE